MAFKEIKMTSNSIDIKKEPNKAFTGIYKGNRHFNTKIGEQVAYDFEGKAGAFSIYGFSHLNFLMQAVKPGMMCRITYLGTEDRKTKFGMKKCHRAKLEIDDAHKPVDYPPESTMEDDSEKF